jgi:hypothetical protein
VILLALLAAGGGAGLVAVWDTYLAGPQQRASGKIGDPNAAPAAPVAASKGDRLLPTGLTVDPEAIMRPERSSPSWPAQGRANLAPGVQGGTDLLLRGTAPGQFPPSAPPASERRPASPPGTQTIPYFNDAQIANIKERLKLTREQEQYWPAVDSALRGIVWRHTRQRIGTKSIPPDPESIERLRVAATTLVEKLREDQRREVRTLARMVGLEKFAAQF